MKTLSPAITELLTKTHGLEPVNIFAIQWVDGGATYYYADKDISEGETFIPGAIVDIGTLESVVKYESRGQTQGISIKLSDTDGSLKDIFNNHDIHARPAKIYQWFDGASLPLSEKFLLFEGEVSSNIIWDEGDRTLTLDIITQIYSIDAGFSPEEGYFDYIPDDLVGKAWPLAFGTVQNVPATRVVSIPSGQVANAMGLADPDLPNKIKEINTKIASLEGARMYYLYAALECAVTETRYEYDAIDWHNYAVSCNAAYNSSLDYAANAGTESEKAYWEAVAEWWREEGSNAEQMSSKCLSAAQQAASTKSSMENNQASIVSSLNQAIADKQQLDLELHEQLTYVSDNIIVVGGKLFPQLKEITLDIEGVEYTGIMDGDTLQVTGSRLPNFVSDLTRPYGFTFIQSGSRVAIKSLSTRIVYIANILQSTVINVKAWRKTPGGSASILTFVPSEWYSVQYINLGGYTVTTIVFEKPLSSWDANFEDDIYVTLTSPVGPNTADIIKWLITTYTNLGIDDESFNHVKERLTNYPSNFALTDRREIFGLVEDIAYQCRCAIWLSDRKFHIKYLPEDYAATSEITEDDIDVGSLSILTTSSEDIVTQYTATWNSDYASGTPNSIVLRYNIKKYGTIEKSYDFFIYNSFNYVLKSASFWMIRTANVFKKIKFRTFIHKLAMETFDTVNFNLTSGVIANDAVKGEIQSLTYNSESKTLDVEAWLPVRLGEMDRYIFTTPADIDEGTLFPTVSDISAEYIGGTKPNTNVNGSNLLVSSYSGGYNSELNLGRLDWGHKYPSDKHKMADDGLDFERAGHAGQDHTPNYPDYSRTYDPSLVHVDPIIPPEGRRSSPTKYDYPAQSFPGMVVSGSGDTYTVNVYFNGLNDAPTTESVRQLQIASGENIPANTWVIVSVTYVKKSSNGVDYYEPEYYMQVPVWL